MTSTATIPRLKNNLRLDEHWVLVRLPLVPPMPLPKIGDINTAAAVSNLYG